MHAPKDSPFRLTGRRMLLILVGFFGTIASADAVLVTSALRIWSGRVLAASGDPAILAQAARFALSSRHPMAAALATALPHAEPWPGAQEAAGLGVRVLVEGVELRLGSPAFCGAGHVGLVDGRHAQRPAGAGASPTKPPEDRLR